MLIPGSLAFIFSLEGHLSLNFIEYPTLDEKGNMQCLLDLDGTALAKIWDS